MKAILVVCVSLNSIFSTCKVHAYSLDVLSFCVNAVTCMHLFISLRQGFRILNHFILGDSERLSEGAEEQCVPWLACLPA